MKAWRGDFEEGKKKKKSLQKDSLTDIFSLLPEMRVFPLTLPVEDLPSASGFCISRNLSTLISAVLSHEPI